jgi:hypothetical protein
MESSTNSQQGKLDLGNYMEIQDMIFYTLPLIKNQGKIPISISTIMTQKLCSEKSDWYENSFCSGDAIAYQPVKWQRGKFKIILDSRLLREVDRNSPLCDRGALRLEDGVYESLEGYEFNYSNLDFRLQEDFPIERLKENPIWRIVARDENLLNDFADKFYPLMKPRRTRDHSDYDMNMGLQILNEPTNVPILRPLTLYPFRSGSELRGMGGFDTFSRLVVEK